MSARLMTFDARCERAARLPEPGVRVGVAGCMGGLWTSSRALGRAVHACAEGAADPRAVTVIQQTEPAPPNPPARAFRGVEQLVARQAHNLEVAGSSPAPATNEPF